jgi:Fe-Mn family superoxide dismutase
MTPSLDRRNLITAGAMITVGATLGSGMALATDATPPVMPRGFSPVPLPFDPKTITGFSEKLLVSHHDNNYAGAVKRLGAITAQFAGLDPATAPGFMVNGLKREELIAWNSMILHEIYFTGFGAPSRPGAKLASAIERDFGSMARWTAEFTGMGKALGGGSGWVVLTYSHRDNRLVNQWANDHTMSMVGATPILVLDMFEHAYAMDFGSKAAAYVDAFMATVNWSAADARFAKTSV